ncbi:hypothetical protein F5Y15DRAFT_427613 [Xylariaceae sp. FL0016]|nr:hypothetical protein F5Y15DRAFT_427613 [Xylariaceae sp. FL0016]
MRKSKQLHLEEKGREIAGICKQILEKHAHVAQAVGHQLNCLDVIQQDITDQSLRFQVTHESLFGAVSNAQFAEVDRSTVLYSQVSDKELEDPESDNPSRIKASRPDLKFKDVLRYVDRELDEYDVLAQPLTEKTRTKQGGDLPSFEPQEFQRISLESAATATMFQCLCRVCPVEDHRTHIAYLSLTRDDSSVIMTRLAIQSRLKKGKKSLIWLSIVSDGIDRTLPGPPKRKPSLSTTGSTPMPSPSPPPPPPAKTRSVDSSMREAGYAHIQVCPEYLAPHKESGLLAMQIVEAPDTGTFHRVYFLPANKQCEQKSLASVLQQRNSILWRVRVARLLAEAALRFDCPGVTRCRWDHEDVKFYSLEDASQGGLGGGRGELEPFLKIEIETQSWETDANAETDY